MLKWIYRIGLLSILILGLCIGMYWYVSAYAENELFENAGDIPEVRVGLVLGTSDRLSNGRKNLFFLGRIDSAFELYENGKVEKLLLSGDNSTEFYNEPQTMKEALILKGVPEEDLVLDFAGFRTLDSVVRANEVFGLNEMIIVSQKFHNERAVFIAGNLGMDVYALNAKSPDFRIAPRVFIREVLARVYLIWDLFIFDTDPKFLGEEIEI
jgi:SanA protein